MKIKGISFFEQHIEKIVLGVAALACVGFASWQFIHKPNLVTIDNRQVEPGEINDILKKKAEDLQRKLAADAIPTVDLPAPSSAMAMFDARRSASLSPVESLPQVTTALRPELEVLERAVAEYVVPTVPRPFDAVAQGYAAELADGIVEQFPGDLPVGLSGMFSSPGQPRDLIFVTAGATFDLGAFESQLRTEKDGRLAVPSSFYVGGIDIMRVIVEREELVNGGWTGRRTLDPIPGQFTIDPWLEGAVTASVRDDLRATLANNVTQNQLIRPDFYPTTNDAWSVPELRTEAETAEVILSDEAQQINDLRRAVAQMERRIVEKTARLNDLGGPPPVDPKLPPEKGDGDPEGGGPGGSGGLSGGGGSRGKRDQGDAEKAARDLGARKRLAREIDGLKAGLKQRRDRLAVLAPDAGPETATMGVPLEEDGRIRVWRHDLTAKPGATYRYRVAVEVYNPFFARRLNLVEAQAKLAESLTMASDFSEWSAPIEVPEMLDFFVTKAFTEENLGASAKTGAANVEVYRFYDGAWHVQTFRLEPGDRIGRVMTEHPAPPPAPADGQPAVPAPPPVSIDYGTDWFVLDVVADLDAASTTERSDGYGAMVLLQNAVTGEVASIRRPLREAASGDRQWLRDEVSRGSV